MKSKIGCFTMGILINIYLCHGKEILSRLQTSNILNNLGQHRFSQKISHSELSFLYDWVKLCPVQLACIYSVLLIIAFKYLSEQRYRKIVRCTATYIDNLVVFTYISCNFQHLYQLANGKVTGICIGKVPALNKCRVS